MNARSLLVVTATILMALIVSGPADAGSGQPAQDRRTQDQLDECLEGGPYPYGPPTCTFDSEGNLIDRDVPGEPGSSLPIGGFLVFGLLWAAIPMAIAASVASSRAQSVGLALLVTLLLGWIGLLLVVLMKPETVERMREEVSSIAQPDVADQIRKLGQLRDEGLLNEEEFKAKKAQLLGTA